MKTIFLLICLLPLSSLGSELKNQSNFSFKEIVNNKESFEKFVTDSVKVIQFESSTATKDYLIQNTDGLFLQKIVKNKPIVSEFVYQSLEKPKALSKALEIFLMRNEIMYFSIVLILTFILSHFLGELKYKFKTLGGARVGFALGRFAFINGFRVWFFVYLFGSNLKPISGVYLDSVSEVATSQPILYKTTMLVTSVF